MSKLRYFEGWVSLTKTTDRLICAEVEKGRWNGFLYCPDANLSFTFEQETLYQLLKDYEAETGDPDYCLREVHNPDETFDFRNDHRTHRSWALNTWDYKYFRRVLRDNCVVFNEDSMDLQDFRLRYTFFTRISDTEFMKAIIKQAKIPYATTDYDPRRPAVLEAMYVKVIPNIPVGSEDLYSDIWILRKDKPTVVTRIR